MGVVLKITPRVWIKTNSYDHLPEMVYQKRQHTQRGLKTQSTREKIDRYLIIRSRIIGDFYTHFTRLFLLILCDHFMMLYYLCQKFTDKYVVSN